MNKIGVDSLRARARSILNAPSTHRALTQTVRADIDSLRIEVGRLNASRVRDVPDLSGAEFRVFSQFGEDGILHWLTHRVPIDAATFVEFGVGDYRESNTRLLAEMANWAGLIIDGGTAHIEFLRESGIAWRHAVDALSVFLTAENLNDTISAAGYSGDVGLVSIDVDGNDYWMLDALTAVSPRILVVEYNSQFGPHAAVTIPYDPSFDRMASHWSGMYYGASIAALRASAYARGYALVGSNSTGTNAFFVRRDVLGSIRELTPRQAWRESRIRQSRGPDGELTYLADWREQLGLVAQMRLVDVESGRETTIGERLLQ